MGIGKVVFVTGSSQGIGRRIAVAFARAGWRVAVNGRAQSDRLKETASDINRAGGEVEICIGDVGKETDVVRMVRHIISRWGRIDVLVNNAALIHEDLFCNVTIETWNGVMETNLKGVFLCIKACSRLMMKRRAGAIINIGSIQGWRGGYGTAAYSASKGGLLSLTKTAAKELGKRGITVNAVFPGYQATKGMKNEKYDTAARKESVLGNTTDLDEVARFIIHLAEVKTVSGQIFNWDSRII